MRNALGRLLIAVWFIGMVLVAVQDRVVQGEGGVQIVHLPLLMKQHGGWIRYLPIIQTNYPPMVQDYSGLARVWRCTYPCGTNSAYPGYYTVGTNGQPGLTLVDHDPSIGGSAWSPDGKSFIYGHERGYDGWVVSVPGGESRWIEGVRNSHAYLWSPDSRYVVVSSYVDLQVYDVADARLITVPIAEDFGAGGLMWSPDSRHLAFWSSGAPHRLWHWNVGESSATSISIESEQVLTGLWSYDSRDFWFHQGESPTRLYHVTNSSITPELFLEGYQPEGWVAEGRRLLLRQDGDLYTTPRTVATPTLFFDGDTPVTGTKLSPNGSQVVIETESMFYVQAATASDAVPLDLCRRGTLWFLKWQSNSARLACDASDHAGLNLVAVMANAVVSVQPLPDHYQPIFYLIPLPPCLLSILPMTPAPATRTDISRNLPVQREVRAD